MKNSVFLIFMLVLFSGLVAAHALMQYSVNPADRMQKQISRIEREKKEADFRAQLAANQLADFKQQVATVIPEALQGKDSQSGYPIREIASVVTTSTGISIEHATGLFEKAKAAFRSKKFEDSNALFSDLIQKYPESVHIAEAHFLLAEGLYQVKDYESSVGTIEKMVDLFPESDLTGFALLRLGRIYETQDRPEDAGEIYRSVLNNFKAPELTDQARTSLKAVAL